MSLSGEKAGLAVPLMGVASYAEPSMAGAGDYLALMKPRVMSLVVFTALVGLMVAPGHLHPVLGVLAFEDRKPMRRRPHRRVCAHSCLI